MDLPLNTSLPFFAYGVFKPGELAFLSIKKYIKEVYPNSIAYGELLIRDGIPIIDNSKKSYNVYGYVLEFKDDDSVKAYKEIIDLEPDIQYRWDTQDIDYGKMEKLQVNILIGRNPSRGSSHLEESYFSSRNDYLLRDGIELIPKLIDEVEEITSESTSLLRLQMAYMLLWTIIERYATLRYQISKDRNSEDRTRSDVMYKIHKIAEEPIFIKYIKKNIKYRRSIVKADEPGARKTLDPDNPTKSINYYYAMRSNITHRGKAQYVYYNDLLKSTKELHKIFKDIIITAFKESMKGYEQNIEGYDT